MATQANLKKAIENTRKNVTDRGELQWRHPNITQGKWVPITLKFMSQSGWDKFVSFLKDTKIISSIATTVGTAVGALVGNPAAGAAVGGAVSSAAAEAGFNKNMVVIKRPPVPKKARKPAPVKRVRKKLA